MNILDVSSYAEVRALLGVSDEELEDNTIALSVFSTEVELKVETFSANASATYATVSGKAEVDRTEVEQKFYRVYRLLCSYLFAEALFKSLPMFSFQKVSDGKAEAVRFESLETVERGLKAGVNTARLRLAGLLAELGQSSGISAPATASFIAVATLGVNPVTNS